MCRISDIMFSFYPTSLPQQYNMIYDSYLVEDDIPDNHFWGDVDGKNWLTPHKNQVSLLQ